MRLFSSWRFTRCALLLTTPVVLCLGVSLITWPAGGSDVCAAFGMAGTPHAEQTARGYGHSLDGDYLAVFAAEGENVEKLPKNAVLLRTLVFVPFIGIALGWL